MGLGGVLTKAPEKVIFWVAMIVGDIPAAFTLLDDYHLSWAGGPELGSALKRISGYSKHSDRGVGQMTFYAPNYLAAVPRLHSCETACSSISRRLGVGIVPIGTLLSNPRNPGTLCPRV